MLDEVEVGRRKFLKPMSEIANDRNRFQKYLRQNNRRADIDINTAAIEFLSHSTEEAEILIGRFSKGFA